MQTLPVVARRRILSKVGARLSAEADWALPTYGIPVTTAGWDSVLHDLALSGRAASLAQSADVLASARDAGELRESGEEFVDRVVEFAVDLRLALAFAPARHTDVKAVRESLLDLAERVFQAVEDDGAPPTAVAWDGFSARADRAGDLSDPSATAADPLRDEPTRRAPVGGPAPGFHRGGRPHRGRADRPLLPGADPCRGSPSRCRALRPPARSRLRHGSGSSEGVPRGRGPGLVLGAFTFRADAAEYVPVSSHRGPPVGRVDDSGH